jgi:hypothetical protein
LTSHGIISVAVLFNSALSAPHSAQDEKQLKKGTSFMLAQVAQVLHENGNFSARKQGRYLKNFIDRITGNPDNEYRNFRRHRCRLSKNPGTLHSPYQRTGT